jgi:hypothetical protein
MAAVWAALIAMMAHALVPAGWMPGGAAGGGAAIIPCDGVHHHAMQMDGPAKPEPKQDPSHRHDVCPFAAAPHVAPPANPPILLSRTLASAAVQRFAELPRLATTARNSPQSARAPPPFA